MKVLKAKFARLSQSQAVRAAASVVALVAGGSAHAAGTTFTLDTTDIVTTISNAVVTISAIGMAILSMVIVIKLFKWVQRVL
jgi:uncharacterized membrane protein